MSQQTINNKQLYDREIRSLFTQIICETESLYEKVVTKQLQKSQSTSSSQQFIEQN